MSREETLEKIIIDLSIKNQKVIEELKQAEADKATYWRWYEKSNNQLAELSKKVEASTLEISKPEE